jgi:hypothetical protein
VLTLSQVMWGSPLPLMPDGRIFGQITQGAPKNCPWPEKIGKIWQKWQKRGLTIFFTFIWMRNHIIICNFLDFYEFSLLKKVHEKVDLHKICKVAESFQIFPLFWPKRFETIWQQCPFPPLFGSATKVGHGVHIRKFFFTHNKNL